MENRGVGVGVMRSEDEKGGEEGGGVLYRCTLTQSADYYVCSLSTFAW
jgi:hypothetical protein